MKNSINLILLLVAIVLLGFRISESISFKQNVSGFLQRAANSNTIELAHQEITRALDYLEDNDLTSGYTSSIYQTPDEDIDFWYRNLKASQKELTTLNGASALEKTNVLLKLRETLISGGEKSKVTIPKGMSVYPNNWLWTILSWLAVIAGSVSFVSFAVNEDKKAQAKALKEKA